MFDIEAVVERIRPDKDVRSRVIEVADKLLSITSEISAGRFEPLLVGSVAKGTYMVDPDIDIFLQFPEKTPREELERIGLEVGSGILGGETRFAEHPYTHGEYEGFEVDIVPCYAVKDSSRIMSNVDRTPFHTEFIRNVLTEEQRREVLLLKAFMKGIGTYGAEIRVEGFSGYLCELLVVLYGTFEKVIEAGAKLDHGTLIHVVEPPGGSEQWLVDNMSSGDIRFRGALNVVDPVDPGRNVSSAVSGESLSNFILASNDFQMSPAMEFFFPAEIEIPTFEEAGSWMEERGSSFVGVVLERPDMIDDILYSQVKKAHTSIVNVVEDAGFEILSSAFKVEEAIEFAFEATPERLSEKMIRKGPPVSDSNAIPFREKWPGAFILEDRLWAEVPRKVHTPLEGITIALNERNLGKGLNAVAENAMIITGNGLLDHLQVLSMLMDRRPNWRR